MKKAGDKDNPKVELMEVEDYLVLQIKSAIESAYGYGCEPHVEKPRDSSWGDLSTSTAFVVAKKVGKSPMEVAEVIRDATSDESLFDTTEIVNCRVNYTIASEHLRQKLTQILKQDTSYGSSDIGKGQKIQIEFVSANPTGPMNIVSARAAAVGDSLIRLFRSQGYDAKSEFYINDSGQQVALLGYSMLARIKEIRGEPFEIPDQGYHGKYLISLAQKALEETRFMNSSGEAKQAGSLGMWAIGEINRHQKEVLGRYRVYFDEWFRESDLKVQTEAVLHILNKRGAIYQKDGAEFLATSHFGDTEDRVVKTSDGRYTYFLPDIAYHRNKRRRGFKRVIDILGPDHQTFPNRMKAAMTALGFDDKFLDVIILQQVNLIRGGEVVKMSKRSGEMVTMEELLNEVSVDAARFFFCQRKNSAHLDFDLDLAMKRTEDNPVYYVQYAHARISSIFRKSPHKLDKKFDFSLLQEPEEIDLAKKLREFPRLLDHCVDSLEPHPLTGYLQEVAAAYHRFYHNHRVISDNEPLSKMRLNLCRATQIVIRNGLTLLGIDAPESM